MDERLCMVLLSRMSQRHHRSFNLQLSPYRQKPNQTSSCGQVQYFTIPTTSSGNCRRRKWVKNDDVDAEHPYVVDTVWYLYLCLSLTRLFKLHRDRGQLTENIWEYKHFLSESMQTIAVHGHAARLSCPSDLNRSSSDTLAVPLNE